MMVLLLLLSLPPAGAGPSTGVWFDDLLPADDEFSLLALSTGDLNATARVNWGGGTGRDSPLARLMRLPTGAPTTGGTAWRKLDVVTDVRPTGSGPIRIEPGVDGIALPRETGIAFLPGEVLARALVDPEGNWRPDRARAYLAEKGRTLPVGAQPAFLFRTDAFLLTGDRAVPHFRDAGSLCRLDRDALLLAAQAGGRYLVRHTDSAGRFLYSYDPTIDGPSPGYNIVRHAGTVYAMLELQEVAPDRDLAAAIERAVGYLLRQVQWTAPDQAVVVGEGRVKLGGVALAAVALAKHAEVTGSDRHRPTMRALGRTIAAWQQEDGRFRPHSIYWPSGEVKDFTSAYYPGEAVLALLRLHALDPDGPWLAHADRGARWLIEVRDAAVPVERLNHDHWLLYALRELLRYRPREIFRDHAFKIADAIVAAQKTGDALKPAWRGSWYEPPRSTPAATRSEGLVCAHEIAMAAGDADRAVRIERALSLAARFQLRTQFRPETAMYLRSPWRALGGFHRSLTDYEVRIDYVQHNISALLGYRRILAD